MQHISVKVETWNGAASGSLLSKAQLTRPAIGSAMAGVAILVLQALTLFCLRFRLLSVHLGGHRLGDKLSEFAFNLGFER